MSWYKASTGLNERWKHIQGYINARVAQLYFSEDKQLKKYTDSLTEVERNQARNHLKTEIQRRNRSEKTSDNKTSK